MRLRSDKGRGFAGRYDSPETDRTERLLRIAVDYEPEIQPVSDFIAAALSGRKSCRTQRSYRGLILAGGSLAALALVFACFLRAHGELIAPQQMMTRFPNPDMVPPFRDDENTILPAPTIEKATNRIDNSVEPRAQFETARYEGPTRRRARKRRTIAQDIPHVQWETERVERYGSGVIQPAWVPEGNSANGDVVYQPVMMEVPLSSGVAPVSGGADSGMSISLAGYTENGSNR